MREITAVILQFDIWKRTIALIVFLFLPLSAIAQESQATEQEQNQADVDEAPPLEQTTNSNSAQTTPQETLNRLLLNNGSSLLMAGLILPTVKELPSTMQDFCDPSLLLECDLGLRVSYEKRTRSVSKASGFGLTRITLDGADDMTTLLYSKGIGAGLDLQQVLGVGAEVAFGVGVTHLRVNNDKAFTPTADIDVSVGFNISRLVYRFGGYYRDMIDARIDGIKYGTPVKALYFSVGLSL